MKRLLLWLLGAAAVPVCLGASAPRLCVDYWVDRDIAARQTVTADNLTPTLSLNLSAVPAGLHTLNYRVSDGDGISSATQTHMFYTLGIQDTVAVKPACIEYWFDDNVAVRFSTTATVGENVFSPDCSALSFGLHALNLSVVDNKGRHHSAMRHYFYKGQPSASDIVSYTYWWNDATEKASTIQLDKPSSTFVLETEFSVPAYARTNYAGHYTAQLNVAFTDNLGHQSATMSSAVTYPDLDAPVTDIEADNYSPTSQVNLTWTESTDDDMAGYNVYVSDNGGIYLLWLSDTTATKATFKGESGHKYRFTVTGRDKSGNIEEYDETKCISVTFK